MFNTQKLILLVVTLVILTIGSPDVKAAETVSASTNVIRIDRTNSLKPVLEGKTALYNEKAGTNQFDFSKTEKWLHEEQKAGRLVRGEVLLEELVQSGDIERCFGTRELLAIQAKGADYFYDHFEFKPVFGWKGAVWETGKSAFGGEYKILSVPSLLWKPRGIVLEWYPIDRNWFPNYINLRHPKKSN